MFTATVFNAHCSSTRTKVVGIWVDGPGRNDFMSPQFIRNCSDSDAVELDQAIAPFLGEKSFGSKADVARFGEDLGTALTNAHVKLMA